jgi:hypothetical protein
MARRAVRPAALSQMPGAEMRGLSFSSRGSMGVLAGKTVSRGRDWYLLEMGC